MISQPKTTEEKKKEALSKKYRYPTKIGQGVHHEKLIGARA